MPPSTARRRSPRAHECAPPGGGTTRTPVRRTAADGPRARLPDGTTKAVSAGTTRVAGWSRRPRPALHGARPGPAAGTACPPPEPQCTGRTGRPSTAPRARAAAGNLPGTAARCGHRRRRRHVVKAEGRRPSAAEHPGNLVISSGGGWRPSTIHSAIYSCISLRFIAGGGAGHAGPTRPPAPPAPPGHRRPQGAQIP